MSVCPFLETPLTAVLVDSRLLVKEGIANIGIPLDVVDVSILMFKIFFGSMGYLVFANQPT